MNKERLKKLLYDLDITTMEIEKSIELLNKYFDNEELKVEFSNSLKYKYLSLFIVYEDFISMLLKENSLYEVAMSVDKAIRKLRANDILTEEYADYLNASRLIRNKIGHRYKQPKIEDVLKFLEKTRDIRESFNKYIASYM
ncbi:hypothetical protein [Clostridium perfringens]|uniref:hypothetical protein n=1 Tax=Clostridium perfringens TaxID=1502 RepID=UPI0035171CAE